MSSGVTSQRDEAVLGIGSRVTSCDESGRLGGVGHRLRGHQCDERGNDSSEVQVQSDLFNKGKQVIKRHASG